MTEHYTQKELAQLLDVPKSNLSRWENGSRVPSVYYAIGISVALHRLVDEIFSDYRNVWIDKMRERRPRLPSSPQKKSKRMWKALFTRKIFNDNVNDEEEK